MNNSIANILITVRKQLLLTFQLSTPKRNYAKVAPQSVNMLGGSLKKKKTGKVGPTVEKKIIPVETDPEKLVKFVCGSNIYKTGQDVEIKPESEYPDWLWTIRTGPPPTLDQLDPDTKQYWRKVRKLSMVRNLKLAKLKNY